MQTGIFICILWTYMMLEPSIDFHILNRYDFFSNAKEEYQEMQSINLFMPPL